MALGGGTWQFQNKILPGTYINFVSKYRAEAAIADRGYATMALEMDWGPEDEVFAVTAEDFQDNSLALFGYDYAADELKPLRDLFTHAKMVYFYRLSNSPIKAANTIATAKYPGIRGNDITTEVVADVDDTEKFDVNTYIKIDGVTTVVDKQKLLTKWSEVEDNDYVVWKTKDDTALEAVAGAPLTGGSNGEAVTSKQYQDYLDTIDPYYFNTIGYPGTDTTIRQLFVNFTKRMRDETGSKFQCVVYGLDDADHEGIISITNKVTDSGASPASLVYWLTGAEASCAINASLTNYTYDGEYTIDCKYSQLDLKRAIQTGHIIFHNVQETLSGELVGHVKLLEDINTFTSFTKQKNKDFAQNQVIRVLDQLAIDLANLFNKTYLGKEINDDEGRKALWGDAVALHKEYQRVRAIQNFKATDIPVPEQGTEKTAVLYNETVQPTCCMNKLYAAVIVA
jgi:hypothetical protein